MKNLINIITVFCMSVISIPALSVSSDKPSAEKSCSQSITLTEFSESRKNNPEEKYSDHFSVLDTESGQVNDVSVRDYVIGAVCAEMPASFNVEALKAQAVASHTYALYQRDSSHSRTELNGADFSDDPSEYQAFFTEDEIRKYYGDKYDEYYQKVSQAVDSVIDEILVYENEPIVAAFHSMSPGTTESAENIWGEKINYLVPQESSCDTEAPGFTEDYTFTADEISSRISARYEEAQFSEDRTTWFSINSTSSSGTVLEMTAGGINLTGTEFREIMSIRSAVFEIEYAGEDKFHIVTRGYGHGVGMSQYGANTMAEAGKSYREILEHYYKGTNLEKLK